MKLRIYFLIALCVMVFALILPARKVYSIAEAPCPSGNCVEREVSEEDDDEEGSLRWVVNAACRGDGDDRIIFVVRGDIELDDPVVIPADCNGHIFLYGKPDRRNVIDGSDIGIGDDFTDNCILKVESDDNEITDLSFVSYRNGDDDEVEKRPGIGLCLIGNRNRVEHVSAGVAPESESAGNDVGVYISGDENAVLHSRISFNTLDGIWIEGDKNIIQGNYIADAEEDCSQPNPQETTTQALAAQDEVTQAETTAPVEDVEIPAAPSVDKVPAEDLAASAPAAGGCQLVPSTTSTLINNTGSLSTGFKTPSTTAPVMTPGVTVLDPEKPRNAKVESASQVSEDELTTVRQAQSQSCLSISNGRHGIRITGNASDNKIGGFHTLEHNIIAYNGEDGVRLDGTHDSLRNTIQHNVFYHNGDLGIDAGPDAVTYNDAGDGDVGPNTLINFADHLRPQFGLGKFPRLQAITSVRSRDDE